MAYTKNTWVDQDVERPKTYEVTNNQDGSITLTDSFGLVQEIGTPVNADNMNHIEEGIVACYSELVNKTGDTMTGTLTVPNITLENNKFTRYITKCNTWERGTNPSEDTSCGLAIEDKNSNGTAAHRFGEFVVQSNSDGSAHITIVAYKNQVANASTSLQIGYNAAGNIYTSAPACDNNNSIVTTVAKNKATDGYFKLGNGLIIQWGKRGAMKKDGSLTVTFPTAFSNTNYSFTDCAIRSATNTDVRACASISSSGKKTTSITLMQDTYADDGGQWIAVGY